MTSLVQLSISVMLKRSLNEDSARIERNERSSSERNADDHQHKSASICCFLQRKKQIKNNRQQQAQANLDDSNNVRSQIEHSNLDLSGPKLIHGCRNWIKFYQLIGLINLPNQPLIVSILFKLMMMALTTFLSVYYYLDRLLVLMTASQNFKNPIFVFISGLALLTFALQVFANILFFTFDLCPMFKILTTPKLSFINIEVQHTIGTQCLKLSLYHHIFFALLLNMLISDDLNDFLDNFSIFNFAISYFINIQLSYLGVGICPLDFYIRSSFGHWLFALKDCIEKHFVLLHQIQIEERRNKRRSNDNTLHNHRLITLTFDEIQKSLNNMDDHLEVLRAMQTKSLVFTNLSAFLISGSMFLLSYHHIVITNNYYHGYIILIIGINYTLIYVTITYAGDRWLFYALSSFVQTIEDEYFVQKGLALNKSGAEETDTRERLYSLSHQRGSSISVSLAVPEQRTSLAANHEPQIGRQRKSMHQETFLIKKKDVIFCREFLHQFENHLATPWTRLTFANHLHLLRTFVTLIAAQIIFEREH